MDLNTFIDKSLISWQVEVGASGSGQIFMNPLDYRELLSSPETDNRLSLSHMNNLVWTTRNGSYTIYEMERVPQGTIVVSAGQNNPRIFHLQKGEVP